MKLEHDAKLSIARHLRTIREEHGLTQADLGRVLGRAYTTIASWESGKGQPDTDTFLRLMAYYRVEDVVGEFGYAENESGRAISRRERGLVENFRALSPKAQELLISISDGLASLGDRDEAPVLHLAARGEQPDAALCDAAALDGLPDEGWPCGKR